MRMAQTEYKGLEPLVEIWTFLLEFLFNKNYNLQ